MTVQERQRTNAAPAGRESHDAVHGFPVVVRPLTALSDDQFHRFCRLNDELQIERTAQGDLLIMAPASFRTSHLNLRIAVQLARWAERDGTGLATESSGGFVLPDSAVVAPDAAWIRRDRLNTVPRDRQDRFLPLCPDFVIELLSPTDTLARTQAKVRHYVANGLRLGWLIDPFGRRVYVYRRDAEMKYWTILTWLTAIRSCPDFASTSAVSGSGG